ncbi:MAG: murein L,D-transpeptidase, partial [Siculibacillus sp.]|nr:murein L,D-transpeptidase [Siculibacillus sp.]
SCQDDMRSTLGPGKATRQLKPEVLALMESKGMRKDDPILVRAFKQEKTLEVWKRDKTGRFALLKSYPLCTTGGGPGPKIREGDKQSPEGFYTVTPSRMNPNSQYHLSYDVGYPNAFDRAWGRTGAAIMVHGGCTASAGCFIGTDEQIEEIYALAREAFSGGQKSFQVQAFPFRMTAENLAKHRKSQNLAFWRNIKQGHDHFEVTKLEPKVDVCEKRYVFDAQPKDPTSTAFNPAGACPAFEVPDEITTRVAAKQSEDDKAFKVAVAELDDADRKEAERLVAEKLEKSKPQKPSGTAIATWFGGGEEGAAAVSPTPIDVPVPRASPMTATTRMALVDETAAAPEASFTERFFSFGAPTTPEPTKSAAAPAAAVPAQPIAVPVPAARPNPAGGATYSTASTPTPAASAGEGEPSMWKKFNPFGG